MENRTSFTGTSLPGIMENGYGPCYRFVLCDATIPLIAKAIYAYFCSYGHSGGGTACFPSTSTIMKDLGLCKNTYYNNYNILIEKGYIISTSRKIKAANGSIKFTSNCYYINLLPNNYIPREDAVVRTDDIREYGYGLVPRKIMTDRTLSAKAKALYAYYCTIAGERAEYVFLNEKTIKHLSIAIKALLLYKKELCENGKYCLMETARDSKGHVSGQIVHLLNKEYKSAVPSDVPKLLKKVDENTIREYNSEKSLISPKWDEKNIDEKSLISQKQETGNVDNQSLISQKQETGNVDSKSLIPQKQETGNVDNQSLVSQKQETRKQETGKQETRKQDTNNISIDTNNSIYIYKQKISVHHQSPDDDNPSPYLQNDKQTKKEDPYKELVPGYSSTVDVINFLISMAEGPQKEKYELSLAKAGKVASTLYLLSAETKDEEILTERFYKDVFGRIDSVQGDITNYHNYIKAIVEKMKCSCPDPN